MYNMASSIFEGQRRLTSQYQEVSQAQINAANSQANAFAMLRFDSQSKLQFIDNSSDATIRFLLLHPEAEQDPLKALLWFELGAERVMDISPMTTNLQIPAGTLLYIYSTSASSNGEKLRIILW
jgi:hypothetical protein